MKLSHIAATLAALLPALGMAQGTPSFAPANFTRGQSVTVTYNPTGGPLAASTQVFFHYGFNGFQNTADTAMTSTGTGAWTYTFTFPANATVVDYVFRNQANVYDNNNTRDWHTTIDLRDQPVGTTFVPAAQGGGVVFRVWAPLATTCTLAAQFNSFSTDRNPLTKDASTGVWSTFANVGVGQEYKFVLSPSGGFRQDPRSRALVNSLGNSKVVNPATYSWGTDSFSLPPQNSTFIYEMHIGSFDSTTGPAPGSFNEAKSRIPYLKEMGVNFVHLMPVTEFPGDFSFGYNSMNPYAIESAYGTPDQLRDLVKALHAEGIGAMIDLVHNHYGPNDLGLYNFDGGSNGGSYFYNSPAGLAETPFGPRPNFGTAQVRSYIKDNVSYWLNEFHIDGFRWDFTKGIRGQVDGNFNVSADIADGISLLRESNALSAGKFRVAEDLANYDAITQPTSNGGFGFDAQWDIQFHYDVLPVLQKTNDADRSMTTLANQLDKGMKRVHYLISHDQAAGSNGGSYTAQRIGGATPNSYRARKLHALGAVLLFGSEGVPLVFQGEEQHVAGSWADNSPLNWSRLTDPQVAGIHDLYATLGKLRTNVDGRSKGLTGDTTTTFLTLENIKVLAWRRSVPGGTPGDDVVILANFSSASYSLFEIGFPAPGTWYQLVNTDSTQFGPDFTNFGAGQTVTTTPNPMHGFAQRGTVALGPYTAVILSRAAPTGQTDMWMVR